MHPDPLYWLKNLIVTAREDDDEKDDQNDASDDGGDDGEEGEDEGQDSGTSDDEKSGEDDEDDLVKLKAALKKERLLRREKERELRKAKRARSAVKEDDSSSTDDAEAKEEAKLRKKLESEQQRSNKLAEGLRKREIDAAIEREARKIGFIDPTDALIDSVRDEVDFDQDKDDPSSIDIDMDSVEDAVKDLADRKKHLVDKTGGKQRSGSKFRRKQGSEDDSSASEAALRERYASLRQ